MTDRDEDQSFKVKDKRRFTREGDARAVDGEDAPATAAATADTPDATADTPDATPDVPDAAPDVPDTPDAGQAQAPATLDFSSFIVGLATQAFMFLGRMPDPKSGLVTKDLDQANTLIHVIEMLKEKTAGNQSEDETSMLEELLYELHMQYVNEVRGGTSQGEAK